MAYWRHMSTVWGNFWEFNFANFARDVKEVFCDSNNIILWHKSKGMNKKVISKIPVDSNFIFASYAWLCVFHCSHRLLWWIKSLRHEFSVKIALIIYWNGFSLIHLGNVLFRGELLRNAKNSIFLTFWESPLFEIREYVFKSGA